jgi:tRNA/rRNA methyltransferase
MNKYLSIILVAPQMGENIGAAARAMKNFDFTDLRIISPRDGWPNIKAENMAVGAIDIIQNAKIFNDLDDAIQDLEYLYATSAVRRDMNKEHILSKDLNSDYPLESKVGIMFGRENCGLTNQEISRANKIITIDTGNFSSLNIAQSIVIICYELFNKIDRTDLTKSQKLATKIEVNHFFEHLLRELDKRNFFKIPEKRMQMIQNIKNIFTRNKLSSSEVQTLRGIINKLTSK